MVGYVAVELNKILFVVDVVSTVISVNTDNQLVFIIELLSL